MNYGKIYLADVANGPGLRASLFVSGCTHHCKGCFNELTWDFDYGGPYTEETEEILLAVIGSCGYDGLSILGGEPMELANQNAILGLLRHIRSSKDTKEKSVWLYSGYTLEELKDYTNKRCHGPHTDEILSLIDVLVDGEFIQGQKDISLAYRGSRNQRIIFLDRGEPAKIVTGRENLKEWLGDNGE